MTRIVGAVSYTHLTMKAAKPPHLPRAKATPAQNHTLAVFGIRKRYVLPVSYTHLSLPRKAFKHSNAS